MGLGGGHGRSGELGRGGGGEAPLPWPGLWACSGGDGARASSVVGGRGGCSGRYRFGRDGSHVGGSAAAASAAAAAAVAGGVEPRSGGVNRHFHMICIRDKFSQNIGRQISSKIIWDHLSTMYDMQALHESEILPFPNSEKNFILPDEIFQEVKEGKVMIEDDVKEEIKEEMEGHSAAEEVYASLGNLTKATEKPSSKEKERSSSEPGCKEGGDKRKRNRVTEKVLNANSNPSSPSAAKRRRT
ncbi:MRG/MORF4L-binding protein isoform X2 [Crotalus tigris]|uniref:MRG/MORF4L-binding protein isoform X2 n=1 Tax=Crotalus tigris TaxID=88082 RepID=UPI00192F3E52|nr:MRG/MORF4L-binding protein isoform X2 [Crotalus tigris]